MGQIDQATIIGSIKPSPNTVTNESVATGAAIDPAKMAQRTFAKFAIEPSEWRVFDAMGSNLPSAAAADDLGIVGGTHGTNSPLIKSLDRASNGAATKAYARATFKLPENFDAGESVQFVVRARMETIADATATIDFAAFETDREGGVSGADLVTTAAQDINSTSWADKTFALTSTALVAGDVLDILMTIEINDAATGSGVIANVGDFDIEIDTRG